LTKEIKDLGARFEMSTKVREQLYNVPPKAKGPWAAQRTAEGFLRMAETKAAGGAEAIVAEKYGGKKKAQAAIEQFTKERMQAGREAIGAGALRLPGAAAPTTVEEAVAAAKEFTEKGVGMEHVGEEQKEKIIAMAEARWRSLEGQLSGVLKKYAPQMLIGRETGAAFKTMKSGALDPFGIANQSKDLRTTKVGYGKRDFMGRSENEAVYDPLQEIGVVMGSLSEGMTSGIPEAGLNTEALMEDLVGMSKEDALKRIREEKENQNLTEEQTNWLKKVEEGVEKTGPDKITAKLEELEQQRKESELVGKIFAAGYAGTDEQAVAAAKKLLAGGKPSDEFLAAMKGTWKEEVIGERLLEMGVPGTGAESIRKALGGEVAEDWIGHFTANGPTFTQRIDTADAVSVIASKPGGAIDAAGGVGGGTRIVNVYGAATEHVKSHERIKRAVMGYA
jgi:hypothetical protein